MQNLSTDIVMEMLRVKLDFLKRISGVIFETSPKGISK